ncbi:MAG: SelB C-terminal domain-containing protein [Candidatus Aminicenantes bacterium]|nr:SelB C-terminal domain-containing protein [Candidatus Aminicenantes bacterium]
MSSKLFDSVIVPGSDLFSMKTGVLIRSGQDAVPAVFSFYSDEQIMPVYARLRCASEVNFKWKDEFTILDKKGKKEVGRGVILAPVFENTIKKNESGKIEFLEKLSGSSEDMLQALIREKGIEGISEGELIEFTGLSNDELREISQGLEADGGAMIFSFSPLFLLSRESFEYLCNRIVSFIEKYHKKYPQEVGVPKSHLTSRFRVPNNVLQIAIENLIKNKKLRYADESLALIDFRVQLTPEEEKILKEMEIMTLKGELQAVSMEELKQRFNLSLKRTNQLLSILIERKKIVLGQDGFILHSNWLEELIQKIRDSGKAELSVLEFKQMTGLTRKYAIPLLELLDQIGVTRKVGAKHKIL